LQCIVLRAAPTDLVAMTTSGGIGTSAVVSFLERALTPDDQKVYRTASPLTHVSPTSPPTLLLHGDADTTVPYKQSEAFESALAKTGVPVKLVRVTGGEHGATFGPKEHAQLPEVVREMVSWLDQHLRATAATK
jgi:dipeptidyl aminopeptidase/acylaminoacyl peptidase